MRIRTIKPEWLDDARLDAAGLEGRVLSIALLLLADDSGRGRGDDEFLARRAFGGDSSSARRALDALDGWYVRRYEVRGQMYYSVVNWAKHQRIDRPSKPKTPEPEEGVWISDATREPSASTQRALDADRDLDRDLEREGEWDQDRFANSSPRRALVEPQQSEVQPSLLPGLASETGGWGKTKQVPKSDHQELIDLFDGLYREHIGSNPTWGPKQCTMIKRLLGRHGLEECARRARILFESPPDFLANSPPDVSTLEQHFDKLARPALRPAKQGGLRGADIERMARELEERGL